LAGKNRAVFYRFYPSKVRVYVWFVTGLCSIVQNFFSSRQPYIVKKVVKEIAYIPTSFQALLKAQLFFVYLSTRHNEIKKWNNSACEIFFISSLIQLNDYNPFIIKQSYLEHSIQMTLWSPKLRSIEYKRRQKQNKDENLSQHQFTTFVLKTELGTNINSPCCSEN